MSHTDVKLSHRRCRGGLLSLLRTLQQVGYLVPGAKAVPDQDLQVTDEPKVCVYVCVWLAGFSGPLPDADKAFQLLVAPWFQLRAAAGVSAGST